MSGLRDLFNDVTHLDFHDNDAKDYLLETWIKDGFISQLNNLAHTKKERLGWTEISDSLKLLGAQVDDQFMNMLLNKNVFYDEFNDIAKFSSTNGRSYEDAKMIRAVIETVLELAEETEKKYNSRTRIWGAVVTGLSVNLLRYANLWQFALGHQINETFVSKVLDFASESMMISPNQKNHNISDDAFFATNPVSTLEGIYFSFGSNMCKHQMAHRTPNAEFLGVADLPNFEFFINDRGVASIEPKIGSIVKGMLWNIQDPADWESLDGYEGVASGFYRKIKIDVIYGRASGGVQYVPATTYISAADKIGPPRPGYLEGILNAVDEEFTRVKGIYNELEKNRDFAEDHDLGSYQAAFNDWKTELTPWWDKR